MRNYSEKNRGGFTLVETILAAVILCAAALSLGAISGKSLSSTMLNRQYETAATLADRQLALIDYVGVEEFIDAGITDGQFEHFKPTYNWQVQTEYLEIDNLYQIELTVSWSQFSRPHSITVATRMNGQSLLAADKEQFSQEPEQGTR